MDATAHGDNMHPSLGSTSCPVGRALLCGTGVAAALLTSLVWLDEPIAAWMLEHRDRLSHQFATQIMTPVVRNGMYAVDVLIFVGWGAWTRRRDWVRAGALGLAALVVGALLSQTLKVLIHRPRPGVLTAGLEPTWALYWHSRAWHSFPSGDVTAMFALGTAWALVFASSDLRSLAFAPGLLVAVGRLVAARHYLSDCLAGGLVGIAAALLVWEVWHRRARAGRGGPPAAPSGRVDTARTG